MKVFNVAELEKKDVYPIIEITGFDPLTKIAVRMKRPKIMTMLAAGKIPNHHLSTVVKLLGGKPSKEQKTTDEEQSKEMPNLYRFYAEICLVEPTYEELQDHLTDDQLMDIFTWATTEAKQLNSFRDVKTDGQNHSDGQALPEEAE